jgi:hypothetical protein
MSTVEIGKKLFPVEPLPKGGLCIFHSERKNMRTFIVTGRHDKVGQDQPDITLECYRMSGEIEDLFIALNYKYGKDTIIWEGNSEEDILGWISESNGDGDHYWMIGEVLNEAPYWKMLLE